LKLKHYKLLSNIAFNCNLRHYNKDLVSDDDFLGNATVGRCTFTLL